MSMLTKVEDYILDTVQSSDGWVNEHDLPGLNEQQRKYIVSAPKNMAILVGALQLALSYHEPVLDGPDGDKVCDMCDDLWPCSVMTWVSGMLIGLEFNESS